MRRTTSMPSMPGIMTSSRTASKVPAGERRQAARAVARDGHREAVLLEVAREQGVEPGVVVDEQEPQGHGRTRGAGAAATGRRSPLV